MPKIIEFEPHGIKCDMPNCDWHDDSVVFDQRTLGREWLNKPCPKCNGNLYTERDFQLVKRMYAVTFWINLLLGWLAWFVPKDKRGITESATLYSDGRGYVTEADIKPGGFWQTVIRKTNERRARRNKGEMRITYGGVRRWQFIWTVVSSMWSFPLRSRWELVWSALWQKDGNASCVYRAPQAQIDYMTQHLKEMAGG